jgi:hypothetical protein
MPGRSSGSALSFKPESSVAEAPACNETAVTPDLDSKSPNSWVVLPSNSPVRVTSVLDAGRSPVDRLCADDIGSCVDITRCVSEDEGTLARWVDACIAAVGVAVSERGIWCRKYVWRSRILESRGIGEICSS